MHMGTTYAHAINRVFIFSLSIYILFMDASISNVDRIYRIWRTF